MPTDDRQVIVTGQASAPAQWVIPGNGQIAPRCVFAHYDGTGAATAFVPALKVVSDGNKTVGIYPIPGSVAAGGSADVSWFPGVTSLSASKVSVVGARINQSSSQSIPDSTTTDLNYQTVIFDTGGLSNLGSNARILTVQTAGLYLVTLEAGWPYSSPSAGNRIAAIYQNGYGSAGATQISGDSRMPIWAPVGGGGGGSPHTTQLTSTLAKAAAGDFFSSAVRQASGASQTISDSSNTFLSAILLGAI